MNEPNVMRVWLPDGTRWGLEGGKGAGRELLKGPVGLEDETRY